MIIVIMRRFFFFFIDIESIFASQVIVDLFVVSLTDYYIQTIKTDNIFSA